MSALTIHSKTPCEAANVGFPPLLPKQHLFLRLPTRRHEIRHLPYSDARNLPTINEPSQNFGRKIGQPQMPADVTLMIANGGRKILRGLKFTGV